MRRDEFTPAEEAQAEAEQAAADDARDEYIRLTAHVFARTETTLEYYRRGRIVLEQDWTLEQLDELDDIARRIAARAGS